jgi:cobalt-zinc-cadmium efflux system outer membrane protein
MRGGRRIMKRTFAVLLFAAGLRAESITLDQAVKEAIDKNLNLMAEKYNISIADARILQAGLRPNPVFTYGQDYQNVFGTGVTNVNNAGPPEWNTRVDFVFERGGKRERRVEVAQAQKSVAEYQLLNTIRQLTLDVQSAFVDAQAARDSLVLAKDNLQKLQDVVTVNEARVKSGDLAQVELMRTRLAAQQFENSVRQAELRVRTSMSRLLLLMGRPAAPDGVEVTGSLREDRPAVALDTVRDAAFAHRPDLLALVGDQARSQADIRLQIAQGKSDLDFGAMYHNQYGYANGHTMGFFLSAPIPLWNRNQGEIARAQHEREQLETRVRAMQAQIGNEAQTAYEQYSNSRVLVDRIEQNMLAQALQVRDTTEYSYLRGEASFVEFLDAERALNDTVQSYNDARADYARNLYLLEAVSGQGVNP